MLVKDMREGKNLLNSDVACVETFGNYVYVLLYSGHQISLSDKELTVINEAVKAHKEAKPKSG